MWVLGDSVMKKCLLEIGPKRIKQGFVLLAVVLVTGCGGGSSGDSTTAADTTPNAFTFTDQTGVAVSTEVTSAAITVAGINAAAAISITGGTYQIGSGTFTSSAGTVTNGQTVKVKHTSSSSNNTATDTVLTIGGVSDTFTSTTVAAPVTGVALPNEIDIVETS
ncbi:MAG: hypothetical protein CMD70_07945 [Gammaproteobacteria bacterium]|nr:hypothetical protein [Gammaproteobacteria bacterium]